MYFLLKENQEYEVGISYSLTLLEDKFLNQMVIIILIIKSLNEWGFIFLFY